jgi:hypothetical protein
VSFAATTLCVASQRVFIVIVIYFIIDSVRKLVDNPLIPPPSAVSLESLQPYTYRNLTTNANTKCY